MKARRPPLITCHATVSAFTLVESSLSWFLRRKSRLAEAAKMIATTKVTTQKRSGKPKPSFQPDSQFCTGRIGESIAV